MGPEIKSRITWVMLFCWFLGLAVLGRSGYVQLARNPRLEQMARRQFQAKVLISPRRGTILDRNGEALAVNVEANSLAANPLKIKNRYTLARILSKATDLTYRKCLARLGEKREFVWIKRHMSDSDMNRLKKWRILDGDGNPVSGLWLVKESERVYPHGELAAHVLGDVNVDSQGLEGVELWMNDRMRGRVGQVNAIKDALGRPTFIDADAARHVQDGEPVSLTIDASLQYAVEEELREAVHRTGARGGTVIVMNAASGEILAMANQPTFNPNEKASPDRRRNRALTDGYEPGSTLKPVLAASALSHGWKLTDRVWGERGKFMVQGKKISEAEAHEKFEWLTLKKIIQVSSNIGAAKVALKLGADNYFSTLKAFGFGAKTDLGFPGEISGRVPPRKEWQPLSLANIGFGQGVLVTPMQMARAYATFLNGGWLVQPTLLKSDGQKEDVPRRILPERVSSQVLEALESVTQEGGTGGKAKLEGYRVAGKTGTAQVVDSATGKYSRTKHIGSFIGFALGVEPRIVIFASIDEPHGIYYGGETAAPLFHDVLNSVVNRFSIPPLQAPAPRLLASVPSARSKTRIPAAPGPKDALASSQAHAVAVPAADPGVLQWQGATRSGSMIWTMPSLKGLSPREVMAALQGHKFQVQMRGEGLVRAQRPEEGKSVAEGDTIRLVLAEP